MYLDIDLTNRKLGKELLNDARGQLPVDVWMAYFWRHSKEWKPALAWCLNPDDPEFAPIDPQQAVDQAEPLLGKVFVSLMSDSPKKALDPLSTATMILARGASRHQRGRGQAASMQHQAVRAWVIRKFNPHLGFARVADLLFLENGKCPRKSRDAEICDTSVHRYDSPCVKALMTAVGNLKSAMKRDGIPI